MIYRVTRENKGRYETLYFGSEPECEKYLDSMENQKGVFVESLWLL